MFGVVHRVADEYGDSFMRLKRRYVAAECTPRFELAQHLGGSFLDCCSDCFRSEGESVSSSHNGVTALESDDVAGFGVNEDEMGNILALVPAQRVRLQNMDNKMKKDAAG